MGFSSPWHWLIVLLIVLLVFGTKKLKNIGSDLGGAVKGFKDGLKDGNPDNASAQNQPQQIPAQNSTTVNSQVAQNQNVETQVRRD